MKQEYRDRAKEVGLGYAEGMYKTLSNPENQGDNFNWQKVFPDMCGQVSKVSLFLCFTDEEYASMTTEEIDQLEDISYNTAIKRAKELVEDHEKNNEL
jgi:hypothetical protein